MSDNTGSTYFFEGFALDVSARKLSNASGEPVSLSSRAFDTLLFLVRHQGRTLSKSEILEAVWPKLVVEENNLNQAVFILRRALGDSTRDSRFIMTVPGRGYCFIAPVTVRGGTDDEPAIPLHPESGVTARKAVPGRETGVKHSLAVYAGIAAALVLVSVLTFWPDGNRSEPADQVLDDSPGTQAVPTIENSVVVLPFTMPAEDEHSRILAAALHSELVTQLTLSDRVNVVSGQSRLTAAGTSTLTVSEAGMTLGVETVLTGNLIEAGSTILINMQLVDPHNGVSLWSDSVEMTGLDTGQQFGQQEQLALEVARAVSDKINPDYSADGKLIPTTSADAWRLALGAEQAYQSFDIARSRELAIKALELDPDFTDALYYFSRTNAFLSSSPVPGMTVEDHLRDHVESAEHLFSLEPDRIRSHKVRIMSRIYAGDLTSVPVQMEKMRALAGPDRIPDDAYIGAFYLITGSFDKAIYTYEERIENEPVNLNTLALLVAAFEILGQQASADKYFAMGEELQNRWFGDNVYTLVRLGRGELPLDVDELGVSEAVREFLTALDNLDAARDRLAGLYGQIDRIDPADAMFYSAAAAYLGETSVALDFLERAVSDVGIMFHFSWLPVFSEVRSQPGFQDILKKSGVTRYWEYYGVPAMCHSDSQGYDCDPALASD